jgi:hypothetical protein
MLLFKTPNKSITLLYAHSIHSFSTHTSTANFMTSTIFMDENFNVSKNSSVFYICLFELNSLILISRKSTPVGVFVEYVCEHKY